MAVSDELKEQLMPSLTGAPETSTRSMMGTTAFLVRGRMFAFWMPEGIVVKAPRDQHADLMGRLHSTPFTGPQGRGFGEWMTLEVTPENIADVRLAIDQARAYIAGAAKPPARRKKKR
jgi:TfoX/Sxy family transcriptional regulator of competence genes